MKNRLTQKRRDSTRLGGGPDVKALQNKRKFNIARTFTVSSVQCYFRQSHSICVCYLYIHIYIFFVSFRILSSACRQSLQSSVQANLRLSVHISSKLFQVPKCLELDNLVLNLYESGSSGSVGRRNGDRSKRSVSRSTQLYRRKIETHVKNTIPAKRSG